GTARRCVSPYPAAKGRNIMCSPLVHILMSAGQWFRHTQTILMNFGKTTLTVNPSRHLDVATKWSYIMNMEFEWDEAKRQSNLEKHGMDFRDAALVLADAPLILKDTRQDYGEQRCLAFGELNDLLFVVAFTIRNGAFRIISARRANARERRFYESQAE
ncbi:BrnT family toxin, partial [Desulfovibrio sp. OttesenSCG-928-G11]|nr:BrnT family toxin [Desulfovibrio sp. OttesenSCG-928-G11]